MAWLKGSTRRCTNIPTVAILGTGIFEEFPAGSAPLAKRIVDAGGAIVSEYLPDDGYSKANFVRRNRLQAALARAVIPLEWQVSSGTAHTITYAQELRRNLVAIRPRSQDAESPELVDFRRRGGRVFTIGGEEQDLVAYLRHVLSLTADDGTARGVPVHTEPAQLKLI